jgi:hypothetical protein
MRVILASSQTLHLLGLPDCDVTSQETVFCIACSLRILRLALLQYLREANFKDGESIELSDISNRRKYGVQHNTVISYHTGLHVSVRTNYHQALLFTTNVPIFFKLLCWMAYFRLFMIQKKKGPISIKSPNILFRAVFVIGYLGLQRLHLMVNYSVWFF